MYFHMYFLTTIWLPLSQFCTSVERFTHSIIITVFFNYFNPKVTEGAKDIIVHSFLRSKSLLLYLLVTLLSIGIFTKDFIMSVGLLVCWPWFFLYSEASLLRAILRPQNSVRYREVSAR